MDTNSWKSTHGGGVVGDGGSGNGSGVGGSGVTAGGGLGGGDSTMESGGDWRTQLQADSRQRIVNKIMDTLKRHLPFSGQEGLQELKKIAVRFEEKIYTAATSQSDYLRKISLKMLTMETKSQNAMPNPLPSSSVNPSDYPGSQSMQQVNSHGQQLPMHVPSNHPQAGQQLLSQSMHTNIASSGVQATAGLSSALPPSSGLSQPNMPNVSGQSSSLQSIQNISGIQQNSVGNTVGQGVPPNSFANQRQIAGRQQIAPQQQQQSQSSQHFLYQQQLHQIAKQKLQQNNFTPSGMQSHIQQQQQQQQNLLQPSHLQSSQQSVMPPPLVQTSSLTAVQQNQQPIVPQSTQPVSQHQQQSVIRQQRQPQQAPIIHQQQVMPTQQQQQQQQQLPQPNAMGQQGNSTNMAQNQLIGQQNSYSDVQQQQQQQRLLGQQNNNISNVQQPQQHLVGQHNNLSSMHQQHLGSQSSVAGQQQQQQQQLLGTQSGNSNLLNSQHSAHMLQSKVPMQQQNQQNSATLLPTQGQQSQPQLQQQVLSQLQSQSGQMQHQLHMQQQPNLLQRDMQQRLPTSGAFQQQNVIDQQKQLFQQRVMPEASSTSLDSTAQTGNSSGGDVQEEVYQKIKSMKEMYLLDLNDMYQKIAGKLQQHDSLPQQSKSDQLDKLKIFKTMLERFISFLQLPKSNVNASFKDKLSNYEKQIVNVINSNRRKPPATMQQVPAIPPSHMHSVQQSQHTQSQMPQVQPQENVNSQMQAVNAQCSVTPMQHNSMGNLQQNSLSPVPGISNAHQSMMNSAQPGSNLDPGQNSTMNSLQQVSVASLQQNAVSGPQQVNINPLSSQGGMGALQPNSNMLQHQHVKQQEQMLQNQQLKQFQQRSMQQQFLHKQQLLQQQQQFHPQMKLQQQNGQLQANQLPQLHQMNDTNDLKQRQQMSVKPGAFQQHHVAAQRPAYHQQLKSGTPFSPQILPAASPQIPQHPSPQIDQQNLLNSLTKAGTPLQSASSPFIVPSPSTPSASPLPGESERVNSGVSSLSNVGIIGHQQPNAAVLPAQSLAIGTPGISASPLLAEFTSPEGNHANVASVVSGRSSITAQPLERLLKVVKSISPKALSASISDIESVVSMIDRIAGSAPGNGSRAAVGEDLVAMTKCRLQARNFATLDGTAGTRKLKRFTSAMPLNVLSSAGSMNDSFRQLNCAETSELESTATSTVKRPRIETDHALLEEIREINQGLIDTVVDISEEDVDPAAAAAASEGGEGTVVKCSFIAVALGPNLKSQYASAQMSPIQPLRLLVPADYPNCSPILLDKFPVEVSKEYEDLSIKARSKFSISLRGLSQPMSLREIARTWDVCARAVISEYAQQSGGGTFSSKYGTWENCLSAA